MSNEIQKVNKTEIQKPKTGKLDLLNINTSALNESLSGLEIPRLFYQLVVFVLDGSGSMTYRGTTGADKGEEVEDAVKKVVKRLQDSKNKNSFDINVWAYANENIEIIQTTSVDSFNLNQSINPCDYIKRYDGTKLTPTLNDVRKECEKYLLFHKDKNTQALVIILSDGALDEYENSRSVCESLKEIDNVTVASIFYESDVWQKNYVVSETDVLKNDMKNLASNSSFFTSTVDPEEIRKHMIKSISTVSKVQNGNQFKID
ncbi:vWA domain-containing protein [Brumimicrobium aurantiacum]|uniref:VWA domain-containing protein n=1 Tax=Brumimicrobium aurantiacum TaxID=1737063 RepID=A0A3E1EWW7_9FLAO|nr:vWA domain-containing protein [Brumimicrobium aurantiacum]RFC54054.1 VWA domain-containing protein [Brumimicrobium aurantiacum]